MYEESQQYLQYTIDQKIVDHHHDRRFNSTQQFYIPS